MTMAICFPAAPMPGGVFAGLIRPAPVNMAGVHRKRERPGLLG